MINKLTIVFIFVSMVIIGCLVFVLVWEAEEPDMPESGQGDKESKQAEEGPNIAVFTPILGERVGLSLIVKGRARVFEGTVNLRLKEKEGEILFEDFTIAQSPDVGQFGPFEKEIDYLVKKPTSEDVILEVFWLSPKDGSELDLVSIPLKLILAEIQTVKIFFQNNRLDPAISCDKVFPVERIIPKTQTLGRRALELLIKGPTFGEKSQGFLTGLNPDVKIQSLVIENGVAEADFDEQLERGVAGSCRVTAIRVQIVETLKQFPSVNEVIISINGQTDLILQP